MTQRRNPFDIRLPGARGIVLCLAAALVCSAGLQGYFGAAFGGMMTFVGLMMVFLSALSLRPTRAEIAACLLMGGVFGVMHTLGFSYDAIDSYGMILKNMRTLLSGALAMASLALLAACVCLMLVRGMDALRNSLARRGAADAKERKRLFLFSAVFIALGSVPYLLLYAPGLNIFDTHDQILQFFGFPSYIGDGSALSDHHPVFLTAVYAAFMKLGLVLGDANIGQLAYSIVSTAVIACAWSCALCMLYDEGLGARACRWIAGFIALYPVFALYAFNMCKDVSAAPFVLMYACQMVRLHRTRGGAIKEKRFALGMFAVALLLMLTRKPSMYALAFAALFLILAYRGVRVRIAAALLFAVALFGGVYNGVILPALGVIPGESREMLSIPFQMTARYVNTYPEDVTPEEMEAIGRVLDVESFASYDPRLSDPVKDASNPDFTTGDLAAYAGAWLSMGLRHPGVYLDAWLNMVYGYFYPSTSNTIVCLTLNSPGRGGINLTQNPDLAGARLALHDFIYFTLRPLPGVGALFFVNTVTWAFLFLLGYAVLRGGVRAAAPWMFFFGTLGICMLSPKSGEIRYLMPILYALPVMFGALCLPEKEADA